MAFKPPSVIHGRAVGPDDHAVRRGARTEGDMARPAGLGVEVAERLLALRGVPHAAVEGRAPRRGGAHPRARETPRGSGRTGCRTRSSALFTPLISSAMVTCPCEFWNAGQALGCALPSAMFTPRIRSAMVTVCVPPQSPTHGGVLAVTAPPCIAIAAHAPSATIRLHELPITTGISRTTLSHVCAAVGKPSGRRSNVRVSGRIGHRSGLLTAEIAHSNALLPSSPRLGVGCLSAPMG